MHGNWEKPLVRRILWRALCAAGCVVAPFLAADQRAGRIIPVGSAGTGKVLATAYGLSIAEVPEAPHIAVADVLWGERCPVQVRAIVTAEAAADAFTILEWRGGSTVVRAGQSVETPAGSFAVRAIRARTVELRGDGEVFFCPLAGATRGMRGDEELR